MHLTLFGKRPRNSHSDVRIRSDESVEPVVSRPVSPADTQNAPFRALQQGGRVSNAPLDPRYGGNGDAEADFDRMKGGKSGPSSEGSGLPAGSCVGEDCVIYRPESGRAGPRIDIPTNGGKPHETLRYPKLPPRERPQP